MSFTAEETRRLLVDHQAVFGCQPLTLPYSVLDNMLAAQQAAERSLTAAARWKRNAELAFEDAIALAERAGGEHLMLARRLRVLLQQSW